MGDLVISMLKNSQFSRKIQGVLNRKTTLNIKPFTTNF